MRIVICGIAGKMGRRILECAREEKHEIIGGIEAAGSPLLDQRLDGIPVTAGLTALLSAKPDAVIDFSAPAAAVPSAAACAKAEVPYVCGTTGLSQAEKDGLKAAGGRIPIVFAPNMSVGVNLLFKITELVARTLGQGFDIEIVEAHHRMKKDAPSGTAVRLAEVAAAARGFEYAAAVRTGREGIVGARPAEEIGVLAVRGGDIVGEHTVTFAGAGERVELVHRAHSRDTFARGALRAAAWLRTAKPGLYDMQDVLGLR